MNDKRCVWLSEILPVIDAPEGVSVALRGVLDADLALVWISVFQHGNEYRAHLWQKQHLGDAGLTRQSHQRKILSFTAKYGGQSWADLLPHLLRWYKNPTYVRLLSAL